MNIAKLVWAWMLVAITLTVPACTFYPRIDIGVDFDYYGGKFHVAPNANIGITGRP